MFDSLVLLLGLWSTQIAGLRYDPNFVGYNLNTNETATNVLDYWGAWENVSLQDCLLSKRLLEAHTSRIDGLLTILAAHLYTISFELEISCLLDFPRQVGKWRPF